MKEQRRSVVTDEQQRKRPKAPAGLVRVFFPQPANGGHPCSEAEVALEQQVEAGLGGLRHTARIAGASRLGVLHPLEKRGSVRRHAAPANLPHRVAGFTRQRENA